MPLFLQIMKEIELYKIWLDQKFKSTLRTIDGKEVQVIFPGTRNKLEGPDFNSSFIKVDGLTYKGDIEIHVHTSDWYKHNHNFDSNYNNVILHVVYKHDYKYKRVVTEKNKGIFTLELKDFTKHLKGNRKSNFCIVSRIRDKSRLEEFLTVKGLEKFYCKSEQYRELLHSTGRNQILYMAMLESFGYSRNREPMKKLSQVVSYSYLHFLFSSYSNDAVTGFLLYVCDLFSHIPLSFSMNNVMKYRNAYQNEFRGSLSVKKLNINWNMFRVRPVNHPVLRIVQIVNFFSSQRDFYSSVSQVIENSGEKPCGAKFYREMVGDQDSAAAISRTMFDKAMINIFLPLMYADYSLRSSDPEVETLKDKCLTYYMRYNKLEQNHIELKALTSLTGGKKTDFKLKAVHQQGLNYLYKNYCKDRLCDLCSAEYK